MADDILNPFLDDDFGDDLPVVTGGQKRLMKGGQIVDAQSKNGTGETQTPTKKAKITDQFAVEAAEVEAIKQKKFIGPDGTKQSKDVSVLSDSLLKEAESLGIKFGSDDLSNRFRLIAETYFKDLRDLLETKSKLTMPVVSGGLGFSDAQVEQLSASLKSRRSEYESVAAESAVQGKKEFVAGTAEKLQAVDQRVMQTKREELDRRFKQLTEEPKMKTDLVAVEALPVKVIKVEAVDKKEAIVPPNVVVEQPKVASTLAGAVSKVTPRSVVSAPPTKPVVSDVAVATRRLMGPVEELASLTLQDFRRLSRDPKEATLKIKDKIDLLGEEQSFEAKTSGIKAWKESKVNLLYLDMLRRSLEGKPVVEVIAVMQSLGAEVLTKMEFDAIMQLNKEIRFG